MQNRLAGIKPVCAVRIPITLMIKLLTPATIQPCHFRRPINTVDAMVNKQEK
ncbi:MAG TPA: hypothetical protein VJW20_14750 [Candidatus Angelobacter sp.]|nr:hypothetical protein [Candidatus Angelobacter sp.]